MRQGQEDQNDNSAKSDRVSRLAGSRYTVDRAGLIAAPHKKIILFQYGIAKLPLRTSGVTAKDVALTDEPPSSGDQIHLALVMFDHDCYMTVVMPLTGRAGFLLRVTHW